MFIHCNQLVVANPVRSQETDGASYLRPLPATQIQKIRPRLSLLVVIPEHNLMAIRRPFCRPCWPVIHDGPALAAVHADDTNHSILKEEDALPVGGNRRVTDAVGDELHPFSSVAPAPPEGAIRV